MASSRLLSIYMTIEVGSCEYMGTALCLVWDKKCYIHPIRQGRRALCAHHDFPDVPRLERSSTLLYKTSALLRWRPGAIPISWVWLLRETRSGAFALLFFFNVRAWWKKEPYTASNGFSVLIPALERGSLAAPEHIAFFPLRSSLPKVDFSDSALAEPRVDRRCIGAKEELETQPWNVFVGSALRHDLECCGVPGL
jgi:hypothetical protein